MEPIATGITQACGLPPGSSENYNDVSLALGTGRGKEFLTSSLTITISTKYYTSSAEASVLSHRRRWIGNCNNCNKRRNQNKRPQQLELKTFKLETYLLILFTSPPSPISSRPRISLVPDVDCCRPMPIPGRPPLVL
jgi:hypothetical protein